MSNLSGVVRSIQDTMRKDAGLDGDAQRIGQLAWILFLKVFDDRESELELLDDSYGSPIPEHLRWRTWAADSEGITGDRLLRFVDDVLFPALRSGPDLVRSTSPRASLVRNAFAGAHNFMKNGTLLRQVLNKVNEVDFNRSEDRFAFGDIYEHLLRDLQSAGNAGEFYTPRAVTEFMVEMLAPSLNEVVLDPACGTGGFLVSALRHKERQNLRSAADLEKLESTLWGVEKKALPHLLCLTNLILHGVDVPLAVHHDNALSRPVKDHPWRGAVDVIVTNPPFGGMEADGVEKNVPLSFQTRETADLFLYLMIEFLRPGGRAAVVLPDGTLFGDGMKARLKEKLLRECNLHTIVRLPGTVFSPYTAIRTNILFFEKGRPTEEVWFYEHPLPEGAKAYNKGRPIKSEEFEAEKLWWGDLTNRRGRQQTDRAWSIQVESIKANAYNLDIKNPNITTTEQLPPADLIAQYHRLNVEVIRTEKELAATLTEALRNGFAATESDPQLFLSNFDNLVRGPQGVECLRELLLQLAVQGALVTPDYVDFSSAEVAASARSRVADLPRSRARDTFLFEPDRRIPSHWTWVSLGQVGVISPKNYTVADDLHVGFLPMAAIPTGFKDPLLVETRTWGEIRKGYTHVADGDVVLAKITPCYENAKSAVVQGLPNGVGAGTTELHVFRDSFDVFDPRFLLAFLKSPGFISGGVGKMTGTAGQKRVPSEYFSSCPVPLPPRSEQVQIVAKLDELLSLCDTLRSQVDDSADLCHRSMESFVSILPRLAGKGLS